MWICLTAGLYQSTNGVLYAALENWIFMNLLQLQSRKYNRISASRSSTPKCIHGAGLPATEVRRFMQAAGMPYALRYIQWDTARESSSLYLLDSPFQLLTVLSDCPGIVAISAQFIHTCCWFKPTSSVEPMISWHPMKTSIGVISLAVGQLGRVRVVSCLCRPNMCWRKCTGSTLRWT
jgi:hypothetical protein